MHRAEKHAANTGYPKILQASLTPRMPRSREPIKGKSSISRTRAPLPVDVQGLSSYTADPIARWRFCAVCAIRSVLP
jgi:hypothetical protein